ncbi:MAG: fluoride efflux transporter CrcB [Ktedonobacteraceae bacterium]|nr:fluoride efflux transporter CrcB [Ktedonobacteraceae bacterium]
MKPVSMLRSGIAVLCGGFCGSITRYLLGLLIQSYLGKGWPYDILLINLTGACALALITVLAEARFLVGPTLRLFINVGFLGAYTTFSSLALGDYQLFASGQVLPALLYFFASLWGGVLAVMLGDWLGQRLVRKTRRAAVPLPAAAKPVPVGMDNPASEVDDVFSK